MSGSPSPSGGPNDPVPFDPEEFLFFAIRLVTQSADETIYRVAIGWLYYALFLMAREHLGIVGQ